MLGPGWRSVGGSPLLNEINRRFLEKNDPLWPSEAPASEDVFAWLIEIGHQPLYFVGFIGDLAPQEPAMFTPEAWYARRFTSYDEAARFIQAHSASFGRVVPRILHHGFTGR